jgi:intracellular sulfur oxidation DsrE/DsrF family protein
MLRLFWLSIGALPLFLSQGSAQAPQPATPRDDNKQTAAITKLALHRLAIHVDDNDAKVMNLALNNAKNVLDYYAAKGETVAIEIVAYGPGLHMLRADTSPVKQRVAEMSMMPQITFAACGNTKANMAKQESKEVLLLNEARIVPSGVVRLMELQRKGYAYLRPSGR